MLIQIEKGTDTQKKDSVRKKFKWITVCLTMCRDFRRKKKGYTQSYKINTEERHAKIPLGKGNRQDLSWVKWECRGIVEGGMEIEREKEEREETGRIRKVELGEGQRGQERKNISW